MKFLFAFLATAVLVLPGGAAAGVIVDARLPAGNIVVDKIEGDTVFLHQDLRDTTPDRWWFYFAFRVIGAEGRTLTFKFTNPTGAAKDEDRSPIGLLGPAFSIDRGTTWKWALAPGQLTQNPKGRAPMSFTHAFAPGETEVWFSFGMNYTAADWLRSLSQLQKNASAFATHARREVLCQTRKNRPVEKLIVEPPGNPPRFRVFLTARHHACEMMASYVLEGMVAGIFADDPNGRWLRENVGFFIVPFVDTDGVEDGDQGKMRRPRDHNTDYAGESAHREVAAIRTQLPEWCAGALDVAIDLHCPYVRDRKLYQMGSHNEAAWAEQQRFGKILEATPNPFAYRQADDMAFGTGFNKPRDYTKSMRVREWAELVMQAKLAACMEIPYALANDREVNPASAREFGRSTAAALGQYLKKE